MQIPLTAQPCLRAWAMSSSKLGSGRVNHWSPCARLEDRRSKLSGGRSGGQPGRRHSGAAGMGACWDSLAERLGRGASGSEDSEPGLWRDPSDESPESSESRRGGCGTECWYQARAGSLRLRTKVSSRVTRWSFMACARYPAGPCRGGGFGCGARPKGVRSQSLRLSAAQLLGRHSLRKGFRRWCPCLDKKAGVPIVVLESRNSTCGVYH